MRLVHVVFALALSSCLPGAASSPERPECADAALDALLLECAAHVAAEPTATGKAQIRKACLERVNAWKACK